MDDFAEYSAALQKAVLAPTRAAHGLPQPGSDMSFHRSLSRPFATQLDRTSSRILAIADKLATLVKVADGRVGAGASAGALRTEDDVVPGAAFQRHVVDVVDGLLERADQAIDEHRGKRRAVVVAAPTVTEEVLQRATATANPSNRRSRGGPQDAEVDKPQLLFSRAPDTGAESDWRPLLISKPHALVPLDSTDAGRLEHPYRGEIEALGQARQWPSALFEVPTAVANDARPTIASFETIPYAYVDTVEGMREMLDHLRTASEIAIDLEAHSLRSYVGIVCLMQISTRDRDWIVDPLVPALRDALIELNEVFADPSIVKVLHGAQSDILWLQRDLGLYVVGLFDTYHAAKVLNFPQKSLAYLLTRYCDVEPDKQYQLADWRVRHVQRFAAIKSDVLDRPIPSVMLHYARSDTHFLLHIYDQIRIELNAASDNPPDLLVEVLARSSETALQVWARRTYDFYGGVGSGGWRSLVRKWHKEAEWAVPFDEDEGAPGPGRGTAFEVFRAVHSWRDTVARELDESTDYVLPNHMLFKLATRPYLNSAKIDVATVLGSCAPAPVVVRKRAAELATVVRTAVETEEKRPKVARVNLQLAAPVADVSVAAPSHALPVAPQASSLFASSSSARASFCFPFDLLTASALATSSSFFGSQATRTALNAVNAPIATVSALFGTRTAAATSTSDAVRKVLSSFSLSFATTTPIASTSKTPVDEIGTTDHVFVPSSERITKRVAAPVTTSTHIRFDDKGQPSREDEIIVQSRERKGKGKKRKSAESVLEAELSSVPSSRQPSSGAEAAASLIPLATVDADAARPAKKSKRKKDKIKVEPFDFDTQEPSLVAALDAPAGKREKPKKRKRDEGQVSGSAHFKPPPKQRAPAGKSQSF